MVPQPHNPDDNNVRIRRGRVESVDLYEIKDSELEIFQRGSPADLQLNFAIFLLSLAFSAIASLATATFKNDNVHTTFIVVAVVGVLLGIYLVISWLRNRTSVYTLCSRVRERIKETEVVVASSATVPVTRTDVAPSDPSTPKG
jgi:sensor c-di-GMP phosphodiesterase-like protein